jgi:hypothetical protein
MKLFLSILSLVVLFGAGCGSSATQQATQNNPVENTPTQATQPQRLTVVPVDACDQISVTRLQEAFPDRVLKNVDDREPQEGVVEFLSTCMYQVSPKVADNKYMTPAGISLEVRAMEQQSEAERFIKSRHEMDKESAGEKFSLVSELGEQAYTVNSTIFGIRGTSLTFLKGKVYYKFTLTSEKYSIEELKKKGIELAKHFETR